VGVRMSTHEPDDLDGDWVKRYRQASDTDAAMPSAATREAILAEGRRVAAARVANPTTHQFDTKQPAANQPRWRLAAVGTVGATLFAAVLMFPHLGTPPSPSTAEIASTPTVPSPLSTPPAPAESASDALENVEVTGARRAPPPPSRMLARKAQPAPSREAAELDRNADSTLHQSQDAATGALAGAQTARPSPAAPAAPSSSAASALLESHAVGGAAPAQSALTSSVVSGDVARVGALLDDGANPEQMDALGRTPLLLAVIAHRDDMVGLLLAHHADPNAPDHSGQTPLQRARLDGQLNIVSLLERAGAQ
jgi:hypothetical protein